MAGLNGLAIFLRYGRGMIDLRIHLAWVMGLGLALAGPVLPLLSLPTGKGALVLVVTPPWTHPIAVIEAAGGRPVGPDRSVLGYFATSDGPDFAVRLRAAGAWAVLDGNAVSSLCGWEIV